MVARATKPDGYRIGELARATGFSAKTLRYYDEIGLLHPQARTASGYRLYGEDAIERLRFVENAQSIGLSLNDIKQIISISDSGEAPCTHVAAVVDRELTKVSAQLKRLNATQTALRLLKRRLAPAAEHGVATTQPGCHCISEPATLTKRH